MTNLPPNLGYRSEKPRISGMAIASMVLGLIAAAGLLANVCCVFFIFVPVAAICALVSLVMGFTALSQIRRGHGDIGGRAMAITGIACSASYLVVQSALVLLVGAMVWRAGSVSHHAAPPGWPPPPVPAMTAPATVPGALPAEAPVDFPPE